MYKIVGNVIQSERSTTPADTKDTGNPTPVASSGIAMLMVDSVILAWESNGLAGNEAAFLPDEVDLLLSSANVTRGSGINAAALANTFNSNGFTLNGTFADAIANGDYLQFSVTPIASSQVSLSAIDANFRRSAAGPNMFQWQYSLDGFATPGVSIGSEVTFTDANTSGIAQPQINLVGISALQNVPNPASITLRLYGYGATAIAGTFAIGRLSGQDLRITGSTSASGSSPTQLAITNISPASPTAGSGFNVTVQSQDAGSVPSNVAANTGFTLTNTGGGTIGGNVTGTILAGTNQIVVSGVTLSSAGTGVTLTATRDSGDVLTPGTSAPFNVLAPADHISFVGVPATGTANANLTTFTVEARRPDNSVDTGFTGSVTITKATGLGTLSGTTTRSSVAGVATFNDLQFDQADTYSLNADSGAFAQITSGNIVVTAPTAPTDHFRTATSGVWLDPDTWESSSNGISGWGAATLAPTTAAATVTIRNGHTVTSTTTASGDEITIQSGGVFSTNNTFTLNNGSGDDLNIQNGGVLNLTGLLTIGSGSILNVGTGGTVRATASGIIGAGTGVNSASFVFQNASILEYSSNSAFAASGVTVFPNVDALTIPIFRITGSPSNVGGANPTLINGIFEVATGSTITWGGSGTKTFRNGIRGDGNVTQLATSGQFFVTGAAVLGGSGLITMTSPLLFDAASNTTLTSNKQINGDFVFLNGIFDAGTFAITGTTNVSVEPGANLRMGSPDGISLLPATGNIQTTGRLFNPAAEYEYNGSVNQAVGDALPASVLNLTIENTGALGNNVVSGNSGQAVTGLLNVQTGVYSGASDYENVLIDAAGTYSATSAVTVSGDWDNFGMFTANGNSVTFDGANQFINGNTTFHTLIKTVSAADTLTFGQGSTQSITNSLTLNGAAANLLTLRSSLAGLQWNINAPAAQSVDFVDVQDSNASGGQTINQTNSVNSGNNINWNFVAANQPPVINSTAPTTATEGVLYTYNATATDPDGPGATWSLVSPTHTCGGSINPSSGVFTFTPAGPVPPASCVVSIRVDDGGTPNLSDTQTTTVNITNVGGSTLVVDNITDNIALNQCTNAAGDCSLRGANSVALDGDTVVFEPGLFGGTQTIVLGGTEIEILQDITITGTGADRLTIDGGPGTNRIFFIDGPTVTLSGMTLTGGNGNGSGTPDRGGAIAAANALLTLDSMNISGNSTVSESGGIDALNTTLVISRSTISGNSSGSCGGLTASGGSLSISNSTVSGNTATVVNGGGICSLFGGGTIRNSTITNNAAGTAFGGGIVKNQGSLDIGSTIIAGNSASGFPEVYFLGGTVTSSGFNIIGDSTGDAAATNLPITYQPTDILDTDPQIGTLADNGGPTFTHRPVDLFPGHDRGCAFGSTIDQRGNARTIDRSGIANAACANPAENGTDIGSVELLVPTAANAAISGRVTTAGSRGLVNVRITIQNTAGEFVAFANTSSFGYFTLSNIPGGASYIVTVKSKRFTFNPPSRIISVADDIAGFDFVADP
ncbi:MAG: beta strand repeat-containing protein [Pyrinomonadaceae bacterium]